MYEVSKELSNNLKEWSEGNEYLYSLLYTSWQHGIRTCACCGGHVDRKDNDPYILFIADKKNMPYFESMIGAIEKIPDINADIYYRNSSNTPENSRVVLGVHCMMHNRMEVFYKLSSSIMEKKVIETEKGKKFYQSLTKLIDSKKDIIEKEIADGIVVGSTLSTCTPERVEYLRAKKKLFYNLRQFLTNNRSKYENNQTKISEEPQVRYNK